MTFAQMLAEAELLYETDSGTNPGFQDAEWGRWFTMGQRKVVLDILRDGIGKNTFNQLAIEKLVQVVSYANFDNDTHFKNSDGTAAKKLNVVFDNKFFWILDEYGVTATHPMVPLDRITYDFYRINLDNPFRKPNPEEGFWMVQYSTALPTASTTSVPIFITDGTALTAYKVVGVYHPDNYAIAPANVYPVGGTEASCLNASVHPIIVETAVKLARMSVSDVPGYQLAVAELNKN